VPGIINASFTANNSVLNGINPLPSSRTGGEGSVAGQEAQFNVVFTTPLSLPADHYFFVPTVAVTGGEFFWLSAPKPIVAPGNSFSPDLQAWMRNAALDPDWLRVGTDIVGGSPAPTFNATFSLSGQTVPEPSCTLLLIAAVAGAYLRPRSRLRLSNAPAPYCHLPGIREFQLIVWPLSGKEPV
jgi:hypothetical protein